MKTLIVMVQSVENEPIHLLLVSASVDDLTTLQRLANTPRFQWWQSQQAEMAREIIAGRSIDVVILRLNGKTHAHEIDDLDNVSGGVPVIVLARGYDEQQALDSLDAGAWAYLSDEQLDAYSLRNALLRAAEHTRLKQALDSSNKRAKARSSRLFRIAQDDTEAAIIADSRYCIQYLNHSAETLFGRSAEEMLGETLRLPFWPGRLTEVSLQQPSGKTIFAELRTIETEWEDEAAYLLFLRDITERKRTEYSLRRLAQENSQFAAAIANLSTGVVITVPKDEQSIIIFVNPGFTAITGYSFGEVIGRDAGFLQGKDSDPATVAAIQDTLAAGQPFRGVILNYRKDGTPFWNELAIDAVRDADGKIVNFVGLQSDVTARIKAENTLRQMNERLEVLRDIDQAILSFDALETIAENILKVIRHLMQARHSTIFTLEDDQSLVVLATSEECIPVWEKLGTVTLDEVDTTGDLQAGRICRVGDVRDGAEHSRLRRALLDIEVGTYVLLPLMAQGELIGVLGVGTASSNEIDDTNLEIAQEVTIPFAVAILQERLNKQVRDYAESLELRVAERTDELRRSEIRANAILNSTSDAMVLLAPDGTIQQVNLAFAAIFGYSNDSVLGMEATQLIPPVYVPELLYAYDALRAGSRGEHLEVVASRDDGTAFTADIILVPVTALDLQALYMLCSVRDITERKRIEENLRDALRAEKELNELKTRFTSMVSHEFRMPLAVIRSSTDLMKRHFDKLTTERRLEIIQTIQEQITRLTEMLEEILTVNKAQTVGLRFYPRTFDLDRFCHQLLEEVEQGMHGSHRIEFVVHGDCHNVFMDENLIRQLVTNLLTNAIKYSPLNKTITFHLTCDNEQTILQVADEGIGIPEDDQEHLFELFHRSANVGARQGTGLGLAIAKQAVDLHGGNIQLESAVGIGTTITVRLPTFAQTASPDS